MKKKVWVFLCISLVIFHLVACNEAEQNLVYWTDEQVDNVFDLSELGQLGQTETGQISIGGKLIHEKSLSGQGYGQSYNLLRLGDDVLNSMSYAQREYFINATADQLRSDLKIVGYTPGSFRRAIGTASEIVTLRNLRISGLEATLRSITIPNRNLELLAYTITAKSDYESYALTCTTISPRPTSYKIRATSSTTSSPSSWYLRTQTSLTIAGIFRGKSPDPVPTTSNGPTSSNTASFTYSYTCLRPLDRASVSGWHKGKQTSTSTAIIKTSSK